MPASPASKCVYLKYCVVCTGVVLHDIHACVALCAAGFVCVMGRAHRDDGNIDGRIRLVSRVVDKAELVSEATCRYLPSVQNQKQQVATGCFPYIPAL